MALAPWLSIPLWLLIAWLLAGCASAPSDLVSIHREVGSRITYARYFKKDWRIVEAGERAVGNCAVFAATYAWELRQAGYKPEIVLCRIWDGTGHAYTRVGEWALDNRMGVVPVSQVGCI